MKNECILIIGPTSSGKTSAALRLCKKFDGEIVAADSRQIYKYIDIGTGKLPVKLSGCQVVRDLEHGFWKIDGQKIWGYDLVEPGNYFSVVDYKNKAKEYLDDIEKRQKTPFIVGGTGFYVESLLGTKSTIAVEPNFGFRRELESLSTSELGTKLKEVDLKRYEKIDINNRRRLVRALEIAQSGLKEVSEIGKSVVINPLILGFTASHEYLYQRVDNWVEEIFKAGVIEETKKLIELGYENTPQVQGIIYKTILTMISGQTEESEAIKRIKFDLHHYIRRQETYFRKMANIVWLDISQKDFDEALQSRVESYIYE